MSRVDNLQSKKTHRYVYEEEGEGEGEDTNDMCREILVEPLSDNVDYPQVNRLSMKRSLFLSQVLT